MTYVLGNATAAGAPLRLQNTVNFDSWTSLAKAYGVTPQAIWEMQPELKGKTKNTKNLEAFVESRPGWNEAEGRYKFDAKNNPGMYGGKAGVGWTHFTSKTQLMLPDMPRLDGKVPTGGKTPSAPGPLKPVFPSEINDAGIHPVAIGLGVATLLVIFWPKKKGSKKAA